MTGWRATEGRLHERSGLSAELQRMGIAGMEKADFAENGRLRQDDRSLVAGGRKAGLLDGRRLGNRRAKAECIRAEGHGEKEREGMAGSGERFDRAGKV